MVVNAERRPRRRKPLTISQAADELGVSVGTLRRCADAGTVPMILLPSGYRRFSPAVIEWLRRDMGMSEDEDAADAAR
jgi:DNA-binding transcriptional MerR regulator